MDHEFPASPPAPLPRGEGRLEPRTRRAEQDSAPVAWMARRRAEEGPLWGSDPGDAHRAGRDALTAGSTVASPQAGRLTRWSRGPNLIWGCDPSQTQRIAAHDRLRGQIPENSRGPSSALRRSCSTLRRSLLHVSAHLLHSGEGEGMRDGVHRRLKIRITIHAVPITWRFSCKRRPWP